MEQHGLSLNLGMLCSGCDCKSYKLPEVEGFSADQRQFIENLCKVCIEYFKLNTVNG